VGFIGSSLFLGWALSALFIPRLADIYGRRRIFMLSMAIQTLAFLGLYLSHDINLTTAFMFLFGVASVGRCSICFLYLMEILPSNAQVITATCL
jgi:MFS family permease